MFFKTFLNISDVKTPFLKDQLGFLKHIVKAYLIRFPFQNITSFGQYLPLDRPPPGLREMITSNLSGGGGLCGHNNVFLKYQLQAIGYDVSYLQGTFIRTGIPSSHNLFSVRIPERASKERVPKTKSYIVDVGCGVPLSEPICVDSLPYTGRGGGFDYKYQWKDPSTIERVNLCGDALIGPKPPEFVSPQNYTINFKPGQTFADSKGPIAAVYNNPYSVFLHQGIYCFRYLSIDSENNDFEIVCVRGKEVIWVTRETRRVESYKSYEDMLPLLKEYFPMISQVEVERTVRNFSIKFEDAIKLSENVRNLKVPVKNS